MPNDVLITLMKKFETEPLPETARTLKPLLEKEIEEIEGQIKTTRAETFNGPGKSDSSWKPMSRVRGPTLM